MPFDSPQPPDPTVTALGQMIIESINREANLRAQLIVAQIEVESLRQAAATPVVTPPAEASSAT